MSDIEKRAKKLWLEEKDNILKEAETMENYVLECIKIGKNCDKEKKYLLELNIFIQGHKHIN